MRNDHMVVVVQNLCEDLSGDIPLTEQHRPCKVTQFFCEVQETTAGILLAPFKTSTNPAAATGDEPRNGTKDQTNWESGNGINFLDLVAGDIWGSSIFLSSLFNCLQIIQGRID